MGNVMVEWLNEIREICVKFLIIVNCNWEANVLNSENAKAMQSEARSTAQNGFAANCKSS